MRGIHYSTDDRLAEQDLDDLVDELALQLHERMGDRVYMLQRRDVADLIGPYIDDLSREDQRALPWLVWHLFQDALDVVLTHR